ncbi:MAG: signal recognition particle receptor subunit alpha, partial [Planctomycetota bacterium]
MFRKAFEALKQGAARTAAAIGGSLRSLLLGRDLDEALIDQVETALVSADVGVTLARELVDEVRREFRGGRARKGEDAVAILKARLKQRLSGDDLRIARAETKPTVILVVGVNGSGKTTSVAKIAKALK